MKIDYCAVHSGALIAPGGEPNCLFIRHDDGRIMSQREIWAEIERLREIAGEGYPGIAHDMEKLRAELERNRGDLIIEADRANRAEAERDALRADAERRLQLLRIVKESIGITNADAAKYDFAKFAEHKPDCGSPRGDQACQCGYSSVRFNIEALLEECNSDVEGATMNSVAADIDAALAAKEGT